MSEQIDISFILLRPVYLGNIGAVARVMKNFGFKNLRLVNPPKNYKDAEARKMSVGAFDILKSCTVHESLSEAAKDLTLLIGSSAGQQRTDTLVSIDESMDRCLAAASSHGKIGVVFGDERNGMSNDELSRCHISFRLDTDETFPSLNLSQAVGIFAYELSKRSHDFKSTNLNQAGSPTGAQDDEFFEQLMFLLKRCEFTRSYNEETIGRELKKFYLRASASQRECELLTGALYKINNALAKEL